MECFYCGGAHPKTVCPVLAADTESGKVRPVGREYYLKDGRKVELEGGEKPSQVVARMNGKGKGLEVLLGIMGMWSAPEVNMAVKQPVAERMQVDKKVAEVVDDLAQQKECRRLAGKAMDSVSGGITVSMRELITVSPMIARETARIIKEVGEGRPKFGRPLVNKAGLGVGEEELVVSLVEGLGAVSCPLGYVKGTMGGKV